MSFIFKLTKMHLQDIPPRLVPQLAKILQFRPLENAGKHLSTEVKSLPRRYSVGRLEKLLLPRAGHLCKLHKGLDFDVVEVLLHHLQEEIGPRLNSLISQCELLAPDQRQRLTRLHNVHALWLSTREYEITFLASVRDLKWKHQECEACIVSLISGDLETLLDLRWIVRSRATSRHVAKHGNPRLQVWVEAWIALRTAKYTGETIDLDTLISRNEAEAVMLKHARAKIHDVRVNKLKIRNVGNLAQAAHSVCTAGTEDVSPVEGCDDFDAAFTNADTKGHSPYSFAIRMSPQESFYSVDTVSNNARMVAPSLEQIQEEQQEEQDTQELLRPLVYVPSRQELKAQKSYVRLRPSTQEEQQEQQEYVPPRQHWNPESSDIYFSPVWEPTSSSRTSWETERFEMQTVRNPADTYVNLIETFPADSSASIASSAASTVTEIVRSYHETPAPAGDVGIRDQVRAAGTYVGIRQQMRNIGSASRKGKAADRSVAAPEHRDSGYAVTDQVTKNEKSGGPVAVFVLDNSSSNWAALYDN
ncbi:hypothetical protein LTR10_015799 [Elasticomyces elasticus]|uniref:Uncharacterized protein n=1 Tax=Exophiala sideris TaxID=1016849 RepID=A0ABR0IYT9_9EURO|nr:hypothetical protein LTR10_015799 [Elasticomyces elasticus]KAK5022529.1 hypothetical protein LTS07_009975 [Exophiala sideris]KAK5028057.1 hypothetical protein LTR13_009286 [Exophiala sideris]KAK5051798.1 hypothetical protein LTR69_010089 [Exophiala sideris]KAK5177870.1 hypothetical protein LTR44_009635 [Eurotiomycetes sp. CCFEE 6388]